VTDGLLERLLTVKSKPEFQASVDGYLRNAFNEVSAAAWRDALETLASEFERGLKQAHAKGWKMETTGVEVADVIMAARELAKHPKQVPGPVERVTGEGAKP
jgi:hypothetical protein